MEEFFDEDNIEIENMREERRKMKDKDFGKLINKKDLSDFELDELFMWVGYDTAHPSYAKFNKV